MPHYLPNIRRGIKPRKTGLMGLAALNNFVNYTAVAQV
jgi:hypothetical protein